MFADTGYEYNLHVSIGGAERRWCLRNVLGSAEAFPLSEEFQGRLAKCVEPSVDGVNGLLGREFQVLSDAEDLCVFVEKPKEAGEGGYIWRGCRSESPVECGRDYTCSGKISSLLGVSEGDTIRVVKFVGFPALQWRFTGMEEDFVDVSDLEVIRAILGGHLIETGSLEVRSDVSRLIFLEDVTSGTR